MSDFEYDCLQKKRIAGQAKYRKRGSKSKKCNLPSDRLTEKQWKERCGPIVSFNFNRPMEWDTFKKLPAMVKTEYITNLQKKYGATAVDLGNMFGVKALAVRKHADAHDLNITFPRGHSMSAEQKAEWNAFLGSVTRDGKDECSECHADGVPADDTAPEPVTEETAEAQVKHDDGFAPVNPKAMNLRKFSLTFGGAIDVDMIANSLKFILGDKPNGELEIICHLA